MISAGSGLLIYIRKQEGAYQPRLAKLLDHLGILPQALTISQKDLQTLLDASRAILVRREILMVWGDTRISTLLKSFERLQPQEPDSTPFAATVHLWGGTNYGGRRTCNAATALTFLKSRFNSCPADRVAIVANLCDYEVRLNTVELGKRFKSLSTCILALALMNGDLSLLTPESFANYDIPITSKCRSDPVTHFVSQRRRSYPPRESIMVASTE